MKKSLIPFNIYILDTSSQKVKNLRSITTLDIFEGATRQLHPEGLFSTQIFGRIGDPNRDKIFAKIDLKIPVFDPNYFDILVGLKGLYKEIIFGKRFAVFDELDRDFKPSDPLNGDTGFDFFMKHWKKIEFTRNNSDRRDIKIKELIKYKDVAEIRYLVVLPAGLRDIETNQETGRPEENEVNDLYREVLKASRVIEVGSGTDLRAMDGARAKLQQSIQAVWKHFFEMVSGKRGYIQKRFAGRRIFNGTRNVISAMDTTPTRLGDPNSFNITHTQVGILQTAKGMLPVTIGCVRRYLLRHVFEASPESTVANLVDPKTLHSVKVEVPFVTKDYWVTKDGLTKVVDSFRDDNLRDQAIMVEGYYMGLIYEGPDMTFKLFHDIRELPEGRNRAHVRPMSLTDLIYLVCYRDWQDKHIFTTRYPVAGIGSIYPSKLRITSTVPEEMRRELNDEWQLDDQSLVIMSYPIRGVGSYYDTMSVHPSKLEGLSADHDGDMTSGNYVYSDESTIELDKLMRSAVNYLNPQGGLRSSVDFYTATLVAHNMTGD